MVSGFSLSASHEYSSVTVSPWKVRSLGTWRTVGGVSGVSAVTRATLPGAPDAFSAFHRPRAFEHLYYMPEWTVDLVSEAMSRLLDALVDICGPDYARVGRSVDVV